MRLFSISEFIIQILEFKKWDNYFQRRIKKFSLLRSA